MLPPPQLFEEKPAFVLTNFFLLCVMPRLVSRSGMTRFSGSHCFEKTLCQAACTSGGSCLDGRRKKMPLIISAEALAVLGSKSLAGAGVAKTPCRLVGINWCGSRSCNALSVGNALVFVVAILFLSLGWRHCRLADS